MPSMLRLVALLALIATTGCSTVTAIRQNTEAIGRSSTTIDTNTKAIAESTSGTTSLIPALQGVQR